MEGILESAVDLDWKEASLRSSLSSMEDGLRCFCSLEIESWTGRVPWRAALYPGTYSSRSFIRQGSLPDMVRCIGRARLRVCVYTTKDRSPANRAYEKSRMKRTSRIECLSRFSEEASPPSRVVSEVLFGGVWR